MDIRLAQGDARISQLPLAAALVGNELIPMLQSGQTVALPVSTLAVTVNLSAPSGSSLVGFIQSGAGSTARTVQDKAREIVSVKDFGAKGNGIADDTAAIQAAINASGSILFPAGTYKVSSTIRIASNGVQLYGAGMWITTITRSTDYGDTFFFTGNDGTGTLLQNVAIEGMTITSTGLTTSGAHIHMNGVTHFSIRDIYIQDGFIGKLFSGATAGNIETTYTVFSNFFGGSAAGRSYVKFTSAAATYGHPSCGDVFVNDFNWRGSSSDFCQNGLFITSSDGIWFSNGHIGRSTVANIRLDASDAANPIGLLFFNNVMSDAQTGAGVVFSGSSAIGTNIQFANCNFKGGGVASSGIVIGSGVTFYNVEFSNCDITEYTSSGVTIGSASAKDWMFSDCQVRGNSFATPNTADGYTISLGDKIQIVGGESGGANIDPNGTPTQRFGINIASGVLNAHINSVDLRGNATNPVAWTPNADTSGNRIVNCAGFNGNRNAVALAMSASTVDQKNPYGAPAMVLLTGGTVASTKLNGTQVTAGTPAYPIMVGADDVVNVTYTVAPTWTWWPQ